MSSNKNGPESRVRGAKNLPWNRNLRIGTLNVRTLAQSGSLESLKMDLKKYNLDVLEVQDLGSFVSLQHGDLKEISAKLAEWRQRFASFQKLWKSKQLSIPLKCKLYRALVLSVVLYSSETWTMNKSTQRKFESFHTSCLQWILCFSYLERVTNEEGLARSRMSTLSAMIMIKRLKWFGHILRMNDDRLALRAFTWEPTEKYLLNELQGVNARRGWINLKKTAQGKT